MLANRGRGKSNSIVIFCGNIVLIHGWSVCLLDNSVVPKTKNELNEMNRLTH